MSPLRKFPAEVLDGATTDGPGSGLAPESLLVALVDGDPELRRRAVLELADRPEARPALVRRLGIEPDPTVREALCTHLARHDEPAVVDGLIEYLDSDDAGLRTAVVAVLTRTAVSTAARVPRLLNDPDPDVRILTVMVLGGLRSPQVEGWLTQLALEDPDPNVTAAAVGELASLIGPRCQPTLLAAQERFPQDPFIGFAVTRALTVLDSGPA